MDPVSIGVLAVVISTKVAVKSHQKERQKDRLKRANSWLERLSRHGYDLHRLKALCKKERAMFQTVTADDLRKLWRGKPDRTRETAVNLIDLSGRSDTVYYRVKEVLAMGAETFITQERAKELIYLDVP